MTPAQTGPVVASASVVFTLAGPQQAWSAQQRRAVRPTQDHPTKSGVLGLVANALGRDRGDDISDLATLQYAVRSDRAGHVDADYHTAGAGSFPLLPAEILADRTLTRTAATGGTVPARIYAAPKNIRRDPRSGLVIGRRVAAILTRDEYVVDAVFTVALTGDRPLIQQIAHALTAPSRSLFLGRRAYPLSRPPAPRLSDSQDPRHALVITVGSTTNGGPVTVWADSTTGTRSECARTVADHPTGFQHRRHRARLETVTAAGTITDNTRLGRVDFFSPEDPT